MTELWNIFCESCLMTLKYLAQVLGVVLPIVVIVIVGVLFVVVLLVLEEWFEDTKFSIELKRRERLKREVNGNWVLARERLPEYEQRVIVYRRNCSNPYKVDCRLKSLDDWAVSNALDVVAWMPLPTYYKVANDD